MQVGGSPGLRGEDGRRFEKLLDREREGELLCNGPRGEAGWICDFLSGDGEPALGEEGRKPRGDEGTILSGDEISGEVCRHSPRGEPGVSFSGDGISSGDDGRNPLVAAAGCIYAFSLLPCCAHTTSVGRSATPSDNLAAGVMVARPPCSPASNVRLCSCSPVPGVPDGPKAAPKKVRLRLRSVVLFLLGSSTTAAATSPPSSSFLDYIRGFFGASTSLSSSPALRSQHSRLGRHNIASHNQMKMRQKEQDHDQMAPSSSFTEHRKPSKATPLPSTPPLSAPAATVLRFPPGSLSHTWLHGLCPRTKAVAQTLARLKQNLSASPRGLVLDVGAFDGKDALAYAKAGYEVVSFEPSPSKAARIRSTFARASSQVAARITFHAMAVGDGEAAGKNITFWIVNGGQQQDQIAKPTWTGADKTSLVPVEVPVTTLDAAVDSLASSSASHSSPATLRRRVFFAKIDAQGYDGHVLLGTRRLIEEVRLDVVQVEVSPNLAPEGLEQGTAIYARSVSLLESHGFACYDCEESTTPVGWAKRERSRDATRRFTDLATVGRCDRNRTGDGLALACWTNLVCAHPSFMNRLRCTPCPHGKCAGGSRCTLFSMP